MADCHFTWNVENSKIAEVSFDLTLDSAITLDVFLAPEAGYESVVTAYLNDGMENVAEKQADGEYYATPSALTYINAALQIPTYQADVTMQHAPLIRRM